MNHYTVKRFGGDWEKIGKADICRYPWGGAYRPSAFAKLAYDDSNLLLRLEAEEIPENIRRQERGVSATVHLDSCLEMFLRPLENDKRYINFEVNPNGARHIAVGEERGDRYRFNEWELASVLVETFSKECNETARWGVTLIIPFEFMAGVFNGFSVSAGDTMRGNFMICGDNTPIPHYGMWNESGSLTPDFHQSQYFGYLEIE